MNDCIGDNTLVEFVEGTLSAAQSSLLERHIAHCDTCRHRVAAMGASPSRLALGPTPRVIQDSQDQLGYGAAQSLRGAKDSDDDGIVIDVSVSDRNRSNQPGYARQYPRASRQRADQHARPPNRSNPFRRDSARVAVASGSRVGNFEVRHEIGRGGMGVVFSARDPELDRPVALKLLHGGDGDAGHIEQAQERLLAEARAMASLDHPHIVTVYGAGRYGTSAYIAMEMITGETLSSWLSRWKRPWRSIVTSFRQAGQALAHAHEHGLAHGDFKPENVLVDDSDHIRVTDFGLACHLETSFRPGRAGWVALPANVEAHPVMGTPRYMAPEQFRGHPADAASDQFSFCVALYEALYGQHPFLHGTALALFDTSDEETPQPLHVLTPKAYGVPTWLHEAICRGLSPEPAQRWSSMDALLEALIEPRKRRRAQSQPSRLGFLAAAMVLVCMSGYALGAWYSGPLSGTASSTDVPPSTFMSGPFSSPWTTIWSQATLPAHQSTQPIVATTDLTLAFSLAEPDFIPTRFAALRTLLGAHGERQKSIITLLDSTMVVLDREIERMQDFRAAVDTLDGWLSEHEPPMVAVANPHHSRSGDPRTAGSKNATGEARRQSLRSRAARTQNRVRGQRGSSSRSQALSRNSRNYRQARRNGLRANALKAGLDRIRPDLEVCFREWRERQPEGRHPLAIRIAIDEYGAVQPRIIRGLDDRVVRKCTVGALERAAFPAARHDTLADVLFVGQKRTLEIVQRLVD